MSRVLFILRCYSGFEDSLINREWSPSGVPTIAKLLERFQFQDNCSVIFISKSDNKKLNSIKERKLDIKKLGLPIYLIRPFFIFSKLKVIGKLFNEFYNLISIFYYLFKLKPELIYSDHANIFTISLIARFSRIKTVIRLMGVKDDMRDCLAPTTFYSKILNWSYKAPYKLIIATQDGAGAEIWMDKILSKNVLRKTLLNGVDLHIKPNAIKIKNNIHKSKTIVTFLGRLEEEKAPDKFLEAFIKVRKNISNKFHCFIIGSGSMRSKLDNIIINENAMNDVSFYSNINHSAIFYLLSKTDIYVSLNRTGNLSNANIEAMSQGKAIIMPQPQIKKGIDIYTNKLITENAVYKVSSSDSIEEISDAIIAIHNNKGMRIKLQEEIKNISNKNFYSWKKRIDWEIDLLNKIGSCGDKELKKILQEL